MNSLHPHVASTVISDRIAAAAAVRRRPAAPRRKRVRAVLTLVAAALGSRT
jgi:hypothetical protein